MPQSSMLSKGMDVQKDSTLFLDAGVFGSNVVREVPYFLRPLPKKGCKEDRGTRMRLNHLSPATTLASNQSLASFLRRCLPRECWQRPLRRFGPKTLYCTSGPRVLQ
jgi:hypothetical protein